ncbi:hypothetical protein WA158_001521 [Blastocystis sp. Blastoise]
MKAFFALFLCFVVLCAAESKVVVLTDINFEDNTQASTGSTTGNWFVKFFAPWCGHCKRLAPVWEDLASDLYGQVNIAEVDATVNSGLAERFQIQSYPTLLFFYDGKYVEYNGSRDINSLRNFATGGYLEGDVKEVPRVPSAIVVALENFGQKVNTWLYQNPIATTLIIMGVGCLFGVAITILFYQVMGTKEYYSEEEEEEEETAIVDENKEKAE